MKIVSRSFLIACALALAPCISPAQFPSESGMGGAALIRLFGGVTAFTAKADVQVLDAARKETLRTVLDVSLLDGRMRVDMDMNQMKGRNISTQMLAQLRQTKLDKITSVTRLDRKAMFVIVPGLKGYASMPLSSADAEAAGNQLQLQKTLLGKETIDGRPCAKNKTVLKNAQGAVLIEATTWNAADLKDFPVQIGIEARGNTTLLRFRQLQLNRPNAAVFDPPAGFTKYESPEDMMVRTIATVKTPARASTGAPPARTVAPATTTKKTAPATGTKTAPKKQ